MKTYSNPLQLHSLAKTQTFLCPKVMGFVLKFFSHMFVNVKKKKTQNSCMWSSRGLVKLSQTISPNGLHGLGKSYSMLCPTNFTDSSKFSLQSFSIFVPLHNDNETWTKNSKTDLMCAKIIQIIVERKQNATNSTLKIWLNSHLSFILNELMSSVFSSET